MTPQSRLAAIRERLSKATPGEWVGLESDDPDLIEKAKQQYVEYLSGRVIVVCDGERRTLAYLGVTNETISEDRANAALIAHAGGADGDLAWLLGIAEAAEKFVKVFRDRHYGRIPDEVETALSAYDTAKGKDNG